MIALLAGLALSACESETPVDGSSGTLTPAGGSGGSGGASSPTPTPVPTALTNSKMYFEVSSYWDQFGSPTDLTAWAPTAVQGVPPVLPIPQACSIPGTEAPGQPTHTCVFDFPEAQLYYSTLVVTMGTTDDVDCKYMNFYPYFYEIAGSSSPVAPGVTPTCTPVPDVEHLGASNPPINAYGYGGAALVWPFDIGAAALEPPMIYSNVSAYEGPATLISGFPLSGKSVLHETITGNEFTFTIPSGNSEHYTSNRWVANDLSNINNLGASFTGEYRPGSMHNYILQCINEFGVLTYETKVTFVSDHTSGPPSVTYRGWQ